MKTYVVYETVEKPSVVNEAMVMKIEIYRGKIIAKNKDQATLILRSRFERERWEDLKLYERVAVI